MQETRRQVLEALAEGPVSGPALAERLGVSRAAVWKHVEALREDGFVVGSTDEGYVLSGVPEYGGPAIEFGLEAPFEIEFHESVASTNATARDRATAGADDVVVVAREQTGGRGRLDRSWESPNGGVWFSIVCRPDLPPARVPIYTLAAAVAVTRAARAVGVDAGIKWPNDVLVPTPDGEKKLCGVLTEMEGEADRVSWVVVGIGVNVNVAPEALPGTATSVREQVGDVSRREFVQRVLEEFDALRNDPDAVLAAWREHALTLGRRVRVETPGGAVVGEAVDIESPGTLVVETAEGPVRVSAGDCEHLRPA